MQTLPMILGVDEALAPRNGDLIRLAPNGPEVIEEVPAGAALSGRRVFDA